MSSLTSVPVWIYVWFIVSGLAQLFDFAFLLLRPRSLTGGDLAHLFSLHNEIYLAADPQFADAKNRAAIAQGWINCIELAIALVCTVRAEWRSSIWSACNCVGGRIGQDCVLLCVDRRLRLFVARVLERCRRARRGMGRGAAVGDSNMFESNRCNDTFKYQIKKSISSVCHKKKKNK
jgi:hypothetical protein